MENLNELYMQTIPDQNLIIVMLNFIFCVAMAFLVKKVYISHSVSLTGKHHIGVIIPILAAIVFLVIMIVKSSLALSLGLVGALSIVRFRTPIKEPEELVYIFLSIAIGLANGADQYLASILGLVLAILSLYVTNINSRKTENNPLRLTIKGLNPNDFSKVIEVASKNCEKIEFNNIISEENDDTSLTFSLKVASVSQLDDLIKIINNTFPNSSFSLIDIN